ncbi:LAQU0S08e04104g1_1 [Lachancea quebecensis]|uniref:LAQU0S08e04104g1_1 n=1 Tax=Lachancea quebecensis TaxID=1654605 RepID=A0A0P1L036_9SACH|nr:LAQU0S08e04104g1_1 [Lachancea quebecensis]
MGIPVAIFEGGLLWPDRGIRGCFESCDSDHVECAPRPGLAQRRSSGWDLDSGPSWGLERVYACEDLELTSIPSYKRMDGQFWCFWRQDGSKVGIVAADGNAVLASSISLSLPAGILAMDIIDAHSVAFGTRDGTHGRYDLNTNRVLYTTAPLSRPVTHVWWRATAVGGSVVTFSSYNASISVAGLSGAYSETSFLRGRQPTQRPIESADLNAAATKIAICDTRNVWVHELTTSTYEPVPGLFLQEGEFAVSLKFASTRDSLLIATSQRLLIYEPGTTYAVPVCNMRHGAVFEFFDRDSRIVVEQQHLYGTHMACFALDDHTSQWSQVGYSDIRAQFGIRKVQKFFALRSELHVLADSGNYSRFTSTEDD